MAMKFPNLLPSADLLSETEGIESGLRKIRGVGAVGQLFSVYRLVKGHCPLFTACSGLVQVVVPAAYCLLLTASCILAAYWPL